MLIVNSKHEFCCRVRDNLFIFYRDLAWLLKTKQVLLVELSGFNGYIAGG